MNNTKDHQLLVVLQSWRLCFLPSFLDSICTIVGILFSFELQDTDVYVVMIRPSLERFYL